MADGAETLADDIESLKAIVAEQTRTIKELSGKLLWAEEKYRAMELKYFGRKSEKYSPEEDRQNRLFDEAEHHASETASLVTEMVSVPAHERKKRGRKPKIDALPVREEIHELPLGDRRCPCCGKDRPVIGEERTSEYDLVPAHVVKIIYLRRKYGPCSCEAFSASGAKTVVTALGPAKIVPGSDFTNRTIAFFLTAKYSDAIPFYRMERMLARSGLVVSRSGLCNLAISAGRAIGCLIARMNEDLSKSPILLMDETTVQVLKEGLGPPGKKSYLWAVRGYVDDNPVHRFVYHHSRVGNFADTLLKGFSGYLQTDGYIGYDHLESSPDIVLVGCFAHIRRKFVTAWETADRTGIAKDAIDMITRIYRVESDLRKALEEKKVDDMKFLSLRKERLGPVFTGLRAWLMTAALNVAPQSQLGKAISYTQGIFDRAIRFVDHVLLTPDTNAIENAIRPFVVGRKNWLFSGSPLGAHASAGLYSLIETAKANGHEPFAYLAFLFDALPQCQTDEERYKLLPYRLKPSAYTSNAE